MMYIQKNNITNYEEYVDEAVSGSLRAEDRPRMQKALDALNAGDTLLVYSRDRLGRDVLNVSLIDAYIRKKKANIAYTTKDLSGMNESSQSLIIGIEDLFAQHERALIRERTKAKMFQMKAAGLRVGNIPYGFRLGKQVKIPKCKDDKIYYKITHKLEPDPYETEVVKFMMKKAEEGCTNGEIRKHLIRMGIPPKNGDQWRNNTIKQIIENYEHHRAAYSNPSSEDVLLSEAGSETVSQP